MIRMCLSSKPFGHAKMVSTLRPPSFAHHPTWAADLGFGTVYAGKWRTRLRGLAPYMPLSSEGLWRERRIPRRANVHRVRHCSRTTPPPISSRKEQTARPIVALYLTCRQSLCVFNSWLLWPVDWLATGRLSCNRIVHAHHDHVCGRLHPVGSFLARSSRVAPKFFLLHRASILRKAHSP